MRFLSFSKAKLEVSCFDWNGKVADGLIAELSGRKTIE
jgi:hypothetical protein